MSEYQYYEFQALDRPLDRAAQEALRAISSRARITATSFANHYEWGDLKGDPRKFMEQWFDLHLYLANWGTRRLMMRLPKRFLDRADIEPFLRAVDWVEIWTSDDSLIIDICRDEVEPDGDWDDGSGWLATLAPLRAAVLSGDFRLFYLLWLTTVQDELADDDEIEPLPGIGPLTGALQGLAEFFGIDPDLVQAAAELGVDLASTVKDDLRDTLAVLPEREKIDLLLRVVEGDPHVAFEMRSRFRQKRPLSLARRAVGTLRKRARKIAEARARVAADRKEDERRREAAAAERARRARLEALRQRGATVWREIENEIERRNASGYEWATNLLSDLQALAVEDGSQADFGRRLASIRARHRNKGKFIERLAKLEGNSGDGTLDHRDY
jgi:hypothetical protein